jgi:hypothetical protein
MSGIRIKQLFPVSVILSSIIFSGCSDGGPQLTGAETGALTGSALGAGLGAIIGHQTGHTGGGIAIGAASGALGGALIGGQGDRQDNKRRDQDERLRRQEEELARQRREIEELRRGGSYDRDSRYPPPADRRDDYRYDDRGRDPYYDTPRDKYNDRY